MVIPSKDGGSVSLPFNKGALSTTTDEDALKMLQALSPDDKEWLGLPEETKGKKE